MKNTLNILLRGDIGALIKRILFANVIFIGVVLALNSVFDFRELHKTLHLEQFMEYQTTAVLVLSLLETAIVLTVVVRWILERRFGTRALETVLETGESEAVELKSSLRWDYQRGIVNKELEHVIAKTIAGFMNARGGTLLIGINDAKTVLGLEADYRTLTKKNRDGFLIHLAQMLNTTIGKEFSRFWSGAVVRFRETDICRIDVFPSNRPAYVRLNDNEEFPVRVSATTQPFNVREALAYIKIRWNDK